jgi:two-component system sensor histidine kinase QseC
LLYQAWRSDGKLLYRSANAPTSIMTEQLGFSDTGDPDSQGWRHYSVWDRDHKVRVIVSEPHEVRSEQVTSLTLSAVSPIALGLPILIGLLWFSVQRGLIPLKILSQEISSRKPDSLILLDENKTPREVRPIVQALNQLLQRMAQALESERRFTDNAAHELRTPLAVIQTQLFAVRVAKSETERLLAIGQLQLAIERGIRLVGQMLTLARLDPEQSLPDACPLDIGDVTQQTCVDLAPLTLPRDQTIELSLESNLPPLVGNADMLSILLSNLIDNAIRYTPRGGHINIDVCRTGSGVRMTVSDDGPGIPAEQRERVFERFYRLAKQEQPGTGLGLAICQRIAELHGAHITLTDGPGMRGVSAQVTFGLAG